MLAEQILNIAVDVDSRSDLVTAAELQTLVRAEQISVGKQQACAEIRIHEKVTVVASADERAGQGCVEFRARVVDAEISAMRSDPEGPRADKRRVCANGNVAEVR